MVSTPHPDADIQATINEVMAEYAELHTEAVALGADDTTWEQLCRDAESPEEVRRRLLAWADEYHRERGGWRRALLDWSQQPPAPVVAEMLDEIDDAVEGVCAGPRCRVKLAPGSASSWFHNDACQTRWHRQRTSRPEEVRGNDGVDPPEMRWRPGLVSPFDDRRLELVDRHHRTDTDLDYLVYTHRDNVDMAHLRVEDDYRFVGMDVPWSDLVASGPSEVFRRLERELTDGRRLDAGPCPQCVERCEPGCGCTCWGPAAVVGPEVVDAPDVVLVAFAEQAEAAPSPGRRGGAV